VKADIAYVHGRHKVGTQLMQTRLDENFSFGVTDPDFNAVCVNSAGDPQELPTVTNPANCGRFGFLPNPDLQPGLVPYDLTRGGKLFQFSGNANVNEYAFYVQDAIKFGNLAVQAGLRLDHYAGIVSDTSAQPRIGFSYLIKPTGTVIRRVLPHLRNAVQRKPGTLQRDRRRWTCGERIRRSERAAQTGKSQSIQCRSAASVWQVPCRGR